MRWRASRKAARCAATWPQAARVWPCRSPAASEIAQTLGPILAARGLLLVGLDVIGGHLTEINVTSPTCFQEISDQTGFDVPAMFIDALEAACKA